MTGVKLQLVPLSNCLSFRQLYRANNDKQKAFLLSMILHFLSPLRQVQSSAGYQICRTAAKMSVTSYPGIHVSLDDGLRIIRLDKPQRKNALSLDMYQDISKALQEAAKDPNTNITALTGTGSYYSSGNDLSSMTAMTSGDEEGMADQIKRASVILKDFIDQFILFPKVLVAVVNGPAIGIAVTTLALCDVVYASDKATFSTPFVKLAFTPEGCSSHTFPKIMGQSLASEVLFFNRILSSGEALKCGLVSRVESNMEQTVWLELFKLAKESNPIAMGHGKRMVRSWEKEHLLRVNAVELERLEERWTSEDFFQAMMDYFLKKSKM